MHLEGETGSGNRSMMLKGKVLQLVQSLKRPRYNPDGAQLQSQKL